jgi:hypothetical protein
MLERPSSLPVDDEQRPRVAAKKANSHNRDAVLGLGNHRAIQLDGQTRLGVGACQRAQHCRWPARHPCACDLTRGAPTRADDGLEQFDEMLATAANAPEHRLVDIDDVGGLVTFLHWNRPPNNMCCNGEMKKSGRFPRC